jgi:cysteine desulfurase/selenocysteine lyase
LYKKREGIKKTIAQKGMNVETWSDLVSGVNQTVPLLDGTNRRYLNLDNAASTPPFVTVRESVDQLAEWYSSVHRGSGFKSQLMTELFERTRELVLNFVHADPQTHVAIFVNNTTEALNRIAYYLGLGKEDIVLTSVMEHHANLLPWRDAATVIYVRVDDKGGMDLADLEEHLARNFGQVRLVAVTGASNVTGYIPPVHSIAHLAHSYGAQIVVDAAQLAAHRAIDVRPADDPEHLDYVAISAHKMYAPYGSGALIAPRQALKTGRPFVLGGGIVEMVTLDDLVLSKLPDREEAGSPNVIGAVAMGKAMETLQRIGWPEIITHEQDLTAYTLRRLWEVPGLKIYGPADPESVEERVGVITFNLAGVPHGLTAAILSHEFGIGVRCGCFCAHPYMLRLLKVSDAEVERIKEAILCHDKSEVPGGVRASLGLYNTHVDVDRLVEALTCIAAGDYRGTYHLNRRSGDYAPDGFDFRLADYFPVMG